MISQPGHTLLRRQPTSAPAIVIGSIISATSYAMSGRGCDGCWRRTLNAKLATAPPRIVTLASGVDSCGVNARATMKSGTSSPPPPMPAPALMAHARNARAKPHQSRPSGGHMSLCTQSRRPSNSTRHISSGRAVHCSWVVHSPQKW